MAHRSNFQIRAPFHWGCQKTLESQYVEDSSSGSPGKTIAKGNP